MFPPPTAAKAAEPADGARGDVFRDELSRKQSAGGGAGAADGALARRPETRPPGRRQPVKPGRPPRAGGRGEEPPQVRATRDTDDAAPEANVGAERPEDAEGAEDSDTKGADTKTAGDKAEAASADPSAAAVAVAPLAGTAPPTEGGADSSNAAEATGDGGGDVPAGFIVPQGSLSVSPTDEATAEATTFEPFKSDEFSAPVDSNASAGRASRRPSVSPLFGEAPREGQADATAAGEAKAPAGPATAGASTGPGAADGVEEGSWSAGVPSSAAGPVTHTWSSSAEDFSNAQAALAPVVEAHPSTHAATTAAAQPVSLPPEARFAAANHENIVTSMRAEVLPNGGTMRLRLDPPQLGTMNVTVQIQDGLITAAFETSSDEATRLLGHSLNQLKSVLESSGIGVDRLQVTQAPREAHPSNAHGDTRHDQGGSQPQEQEQSARQEQQRREMLRRMWRRLTGEPDPLDLTA
jgi:flagellar hook-length control protein FliK